MTNKFYTTLHFVGMFLEASGISGERLPELGPVGKETAKLSSTKTVLFWDVLEYIGADRKKRLLP
jgi:hypothetical protein